MDGKQRVALIELRTHGNDGTPAQLIRCQFGNDLGSACLELDNQAQIISYEEYYPYGSTSYQGVSQTLSSAAKRYRYTGKERDEETGLNYHGARYYAPWLGRWVACDPSGISDGLNLFGYVNGNPIRLIDTKGTQGQPPVVVPPPPSPPPQFRVTYVRSPTPPKARKSARMLALWLLQPPKPSKKRPRSKPWKRRFSKHSPTS